MRLALSKLIRIGLVILATLTVVATAAQVLPRPSPALSGRSLQNLLVPTGLAKPAQIQLRGGVASSVEENLATEIRLSDAHFADLDHDGDSDAVALVRTRVRLLTATPNDKQPQLLPGHFVDNIAIVAFSNHNGEALPIPAPVVLGPNVTVKQLGFTNIKGKDLLGLSSSQNMISVEYVSHTVLPAQIQTGSTHQKLLINLERQRLRAQPINVSQKNTAPSGKDLTWGHEIIVNKSPTEAENFTGQQKGLIAYGSQQVFFVRTITGQKISISVDNSAASIGFSLVDPLGKIMVTPTDRRRNFTSTAEYGGLYQVVVDAADPSTPAPFFLTASLSKTLHTQDPSGVTRQESTVHLTFDDGPNPTYTPKILALLRKYNAEATFFVLGENAKKYPDLTTEIINDGHVVSNHTYSHASLRGVSQEKFNEEVNRTQEILGENAGSCLRPPYAYMDNNTRPWAAKLGLDLALWDVDTEDWKRPGTETIVKKATEKLPPGAVILMHDSGGDRTQTVEALEQVLQKLSDQGRRFETMCEPR